MVAGAWWWLKCGDARWWNNVRRGMAVWCWSNTWQIFPIGLMKEEKESADDINARVGQHKDLSCLSLYLNPSPNKKDG